MRRSRVAVAGRRTSSDRGVIRLVSFKTIAVVFAVTALLAAVALAICTSPAVGEQEAPTAVLPVVNCPPTSPNNFNSAVRRLDKRQAYRHWYIGKHHKRVVRYRAKPTTCDLKKLRRQVKAERRIWKRVRVVIPPLLKRIAQCENDTGSYTRVNYAFPSPSTAAGRFMMIDGTFWSWARGAGIQNPRQWRYAHYAPPRVQDLAAVYGFAGGRGISHWNPSRGCWG